MPPPATARSTPAFLDLKLAAGIVLVLALLRLLAGAVTGLSSDEAYYAFWSTHPATGYLDHPPMVAWMMAAGQALLGANEFGVRAPTVLALALATAAIFRTADILAGRAAAVLAAILLNFAPGMALGYIATPDAPSVLFWAATLWAVAEFIRGRNANWWLLAGVFAGLGLTSKYTDAFLPLGLLLFLLISRERRGWLKLWQVWGGVVLAALTFAPNFIWNAQNGWASMLFQGGRTDIGSIDLTALYRIYALGMGFLLTMGPVLAIPAFIGLALALFPRSERWQRLALPAWTGIPGLAYFLFHSLHGGVEANWPLPLWPGLVVLGATVLVAWWERRPRLTAALLVLQIVIGVAVAVAVNVQIFVQPLNLRYDRTNETRDWPALVAQIESVAEANGAGWVATTNNYALTGELATYLRFRGSTLPVRQIDEDARWRFLPPLPAEVIASPALFIGRADRSPTQFASARLVGTASRHDRFGEIDRFGLYLVTGARPAS